MRKFVKFVKLYNYSKIYIRINIIYICKWRHEMEMEMEPEFQNK
jgi:hypothetical protein